MWAVLSHTVVCDCLQPHVLYVACQAPLSMEILQTRILEWVAMPSSRGSSQPGIKPRSPTLQVDSLPSEPPGKHMNTGVGSLSLLQGTFLSQESNWGLLHCRWILQQLSTFTSHLYFLCYVSSMFPLHLFIDYLLLSLSIYVSFIYIHEVNILLTTVIEIIFQYF